MVVEKEILPYLTWLLRGSGETFADGQGAIVLFVLIVFTLFLLSLVGGFLVSLVRHGPMRAGENTYRTLVEGTQGLLRISPRRVGALARLAFKESLRRRVWVALVVFGLILMFAAWFLQTDHQEPARLYLSFVLTATTYLILLLSLLLAAFSLPNDFKNRTIYTIVTKPVRPGDVVLGRILGFTAIGTVLLAIMAACSWVFVTGSLTHTHAADLETIERVEGSSGESLGQRGATTYDQHHKHTFTVGSERFGSTDPAHEHTHAVEPLGDGLQVLPAEDYLRARTPQFGKIGFLDRNGVAAARGISVGNEWAYRSFIQGASQAAAIWTFEGVGRDIMLDYEDGGGLYLPVELTTRVYRSYVGDIEAQIQGSIQLRNPDTGVKSSLRVFGAREYSIVSFDFANEQTDTDQNEITILDDLITEDGRVEVIVQCLDRAQYFGFAQADCFLRLPEGSALWNFVKGYLSIWMQMVIVISVAVTCSTFLSGPIAMVFTVSFLLLGFMREFFVKVATGESYGGGPIESLVRMATHMNQMSPLTPSPAVTLMETIDRGLEAMMLAVAYVLPDFGTLLSRVNYVSEGFSLPGDALGRDMTLCAAYVVGLVVVGYFSLKIREVAK